MIFQPSVRLNWACSLSLYLFIGNSCIGLSGPTISGSFDANISSTLYFSDTDETVEVTFHIQEETLGLTVY